MLRYHFQAPSPGGPISSTVHISSSCLFLRTALSRRGGPLFSRGDCAPTFSFSTSFLHAVLLFLWMMIHSVDPWAFHSALGQPSPIHCLFYKLNLLFYIALTLFQSTSVVRRLFSYYSCKYPKGQNLDSFSFYLRTTSVPSRSRCSITARWIKSNLQNICASSVGRLHSVSIERKPQSNSSYFKDGPPLKDPVLLIFALSQAPTARKMPKTSLSSHNLLS